MKKLLLIFILLNLCSCLNPAEQKAVSEKADKACKIEGHKEGEPGYVECKKIVEDELTRRMISQYHSNMGGGGMLSDGNVTQCAGLSMMGGTAAGQAFQECHMAIRAPMQYDAYKQRQIQQQQLEQMQQMNSNLFLMNSALRGQ